LLLFFFFFSHPLSYLFLWRLCSHQDTHSQHTHSLHKTSGTSFNYCTISTSECDCVKDYDTRLADSFASTEGLVGALKVETLSKSQPAPSAQLTAEADFPALFASMAGNEQLAVVFSNPLAWARIEVTGLVINTTTAFAANGNNQLCTQAPTFAVVDAAGEPVASQVVVDPARSETNLYINVTLDALGYNTYFITKTSGSTLACVNILNDESSAFNLTNGAVMLTFDGTGRVQLFWDTHGHNSPVSVDHVHYQEQLPTQPNIFTGSNM
jgi:hypothetical protein